MVKSLPAMQETRVQPLAWRNPLEKGITPPPESHGQRSLAGYSSWGRKGSDTTERLTLTGRGEMEVTGLLSLGPPAAARLGDACSPGPPCCLCATEHSSGARPSPWWSSPP